MTKKHSASATPHSEVPTRSEGAMAMKPRLDITIRTSINAGTVILVAEILRVERGLEERPAKDAVQAIRDAVRSLNAKWEQ